MGKCQLAVELEDPERIYQGGDKVRGVVTVTVDKNVKSKSLTIESAWATHGRGNVNRGTSETATEFPEEWVPGKEYRYPFELTAATWPPTYHGHYLSVDHYINARAHLAWAFDPKSSAPFRVFAANGPDAMEQPDSAVGGCFGKAIIGFIVTVFLLVFVFNPFVWVFGLLAAVFGGGYWFVWTYLPRKKLGEVLFELSADKVVPGENLEGELVLSPNSKVPINKIDLEVTALERCVSGSGTNKTTHTHVVFKKSELLMGEGELKAGEEVRLPVNVELPAEPIFSLDLGSNSVIWSGKLRIDIPRWPDWTKVVPFTVYPPQISDVVPEVVEKAPPLKSVPVDDFSQSQEISFAETVAMVHASLDDNDTVDELVEAVTGLPMRITAVIEGRVVYEGNDPHGHPKGYSVLAHSEGNQLPMQIFIRAEQRDQFSQLSRMVWAGTGQIVGYSHRLDRLLVKVD